jgi:hypothetical protein
MLEHRLRELRRESPGPALDPEAELLFADWEGGYPPSAQANMVFMAASATRRRHRGQRQVRHPKNLHGGTAQPLGPERRPDPKPQRPRHRRVVAGSNQGSRRRNRHARRAGIVRRRAGSGRRVSVRPMARRRVCASRLATTSKGAPAPRPPLRPEKAAPSISKPAASEWLVSAHGCPCRTRQQGPVSDLRPAVGAWLQDLSPDTTT